MADPGIFQFVGESVDKAMDSFVGATSAQVIADFAPIAMLGATIYFALMGYMIIAGRIQTPGGSVLLQAVKFLVLFSLARWAGTTTGWWKVIAVWRTAWPRRSRPRAPAANPCPFTRRSTTPSVRAGTLPRISGSKV